MGAARRVRLDELLVARGLAETRSQAKALIMAGRVRRGTEVLDKPGKELPQDAAVELLAPPRFVGRGAEKLEAFLEAFPLAVAGLRVLDVGASTGGFTDCLLQRGAVHATCVDVGHGQLHAKLRADPRVANLEGLNARHLRPGDLPHPAYPLVVMDLSFISLTKVWPAVWPLLEPGGHLVALVKPQFEAERKEASKGAGVIRDDAIRLRVFAEVKEFALRELPGCAVFAELESPVHGADGNREFLLGLRRAPAGPA